MTDLYSTGSKERANKDLKHAARMTNFRPENLTSQVHFGIASCPFLVHCCLCLVAQVAQQLHLHEATQQVPAKPGAVGPQCGMGAVRHVQCVTGSGMHIVDSEVLLAEAESCAVRGAQFLRDQFASCTLDQQRKCSQVQF